MAVVGSPFPNISIPQDMSPLRVTGLFLIFFGGVLGPIITFATPIGCSVIGGIMVLIFGLTFLVGVGLFIASVLQKKNK